MAAFPLPLTQPAGRTVTEALSLPETWKSWNDQTKFMTEDGCKTGVKSPRWGKSKSKTAQALLPPFPSLLVCPLDCEPS